MINVFYHGEFFYAGKVWHGKHEAYYPKSRYEERLKRLSMNSAGVKARECNYAFRKFIKCQKCGKSLTPDFKKDQFLYYIHNCPKQKTKEGKRIYIPESAIIKSIDEQIEKLRYSKSFAEFLKNLFKQTVEIKRSDHNLSVTALSRIISDLELKQDKLFDLHMDGEIDKEALKRKLDAMRKEINLHESEKKRKE